MRTNKMTLALSLSALLMLGTACGKLKTEGASDSASLDPNAISEVGTAANNESQEIEKDPKQETYSKLQQRAIIEMLSEMQASQVDGLMKNTKTMATKTSSWGSVSENVNDGVSGNNSTGWGASAPAPTDPEPSTPPEDVFITNDTIKVSRDCEFGGKARAFITPNLALNQRDVSSIFDNNSTPELTTKVDKTTIIFENCQVADENFNEYVINGRLDASSASASSIFTAETTGQGITFDGSGLSDIKGKLSIKDGDKVNDCGIDLSAEVTDSFGDVFVAQKAGVVALDATLNGKLCDKSGKISVSDEVQF